MMTMDATINWMLAVFIYSLRTGAFLFSIPIFSGKGIPAMAKISLAFALGLFASKAAGVDGISLQTADASLAITIIGELLTGALMGFMVHILFMAITFAYEISGIQSSFSIAMVFDPVNSEQVSVLSVFMVAIAILLFFALNMHHLLVGAMMLSFTKIPPGSFSMFSGEVAQYLINYFSVCFEAAVRLAMPVMTITLMSYVLMGLIMRAAPQMNMFMNVAFIVNMSLGIVMMVITLPRARFFFENLGTQLGRHVFGLV